MTIIKYGKSFIKVAFTATFVTYLSDIIYSNYNQILDKQIILSPFLIAVIIILYVLWLLFFEYAWEFSLRNLFLNNVQVSRADSALAFARSFLYKYIPGKIWLIGARTEFLLKRGVPRSHVLNATIMEQLNTFVTPIFFLCIISPFLRITLAPSFALYVYYIIFFSGIIGLALWLLLPFYFSRFLIKRLRRINIKQESLTSIKSPSHWLFFVALFFLITAFQGVISIPIISGFLDSPNILDSLQWIYLIAAYPFARVIGQLGIIAPSGLGVREGAYIFLASPVIGVENSTLVSVWFRFLTILAEIIFFLIISLVAKKVKSKVIPA
jgi:hypothetical protein